MNFRGGCRAIIINNKEFIPENLGERDGTDKDAAELQERFKALGFVVIRMDDQTVLQILLLLEREAKRDHSDESCFVCCILSHGKEGKICDKTGKDISIDMLIQYFRGDQCPTLAGKPKIFVIQACRGTGMDSGVTLMDAAQDDGLHRIPVEADFLLAYSTVPGYISWRHKKKGTWFVQALCWVLEKYGKTEEIMTLMTRVNHKVAYDFETENEKESMNRKKQVPSIVTRLTKQLYLGKISCVVQTYFARK